MIIPTALSVTGLSKLFRVPHAADLDDPRRERHSRWRDKFWALRNISFTVPAGQTLGIVGANGSGKSTLLKILAGVMSPDRGEFKAQGRIGALLELGAGFHPDLTGLDNVYLNGALLGFTIQQIDRLLPEIIAFAELERFMDMPVRHYSSGMHARLGFAVATRLVPEILLMDETFATGDARFQAKALAHIGQMKARGHTMLLVSHSMELLSDLADRVLWLEIGRVHMLGDTREVLAEYRRSQQAVFRGAELRRGHAGLELMFQPVAQPPGPVVFGEIFLFTMDESGEQSEKNGILNVDIGSRFGIHIELEHDSASEPRFIFLETAWLRVADGRVLAQSRDEFQLNACADRTELRLALSGPRLHAAEWRIALAIRLKSDKPNSEEAREQVPYNDRRELPTRIMTHDPQNEIPTLTSLNARWSTK